MPLHEAQAVRVEMALGALVVEHVVVIIAHHLGGVKVRVRHAGVRNKRQQQDDAPLQVEPCSRKL